MRYMDTNGILATYYVDENASLVEIEAGLIHGILSTYMLRKITRFIRGIPSSCILMKILRSQNRSWNGARILAKVEDG